MTSPHDVQVPCAHKIFHGRVENDYGRPQQVSLFDGTASFSLPNIRFIGLNHSSHAIEIVLEAVAYLISNAHFSIHRPAVDALTSTRLSKNVAPPPISLKAEDVVPLTLEPPGESLFQ